MSYFCCLLQIHDSYHIEIILTTDQISLRLVFANNNKKNDNHINDTLQTLSLEQKYSESCLNQISLWLTFVLILCRLS